MEITAALYSLASTSSTSKLYNTFLCGTSRVGLEMYTVPRDITTKETFDTKLRRLDSKRDPSKGLSASHILYTQYPL
jgi:hypothetical protein